MFLALHRSRQADKNLHNTEFHGQGREDPHVGVLLRIPFQGAQGGGQDAITVADRHADPDSANVHPELDALGAAAGLGSFIHGSSVIAG